MSYNDRITCPECGAIDGKDPHRIGCNGGNKQLTKLGQLPRTGFAARVQAAAQEGKIAANLFDYTKYPNRIVLCIDDSGSMATSMNKSENRQHSAFNENYPQISDSRMTMCKKACEEFLNVCDSRDTALGMYTISTGKQISLSVAYPMLLAEIRALYDSGGTPTIQTLDNIIQKERINRVVLVSDGESGCVTWDYSTEHYLEGPKQLTQEAQRVLNKYKEAKAVIDTVYIGTEGDNGETEMRLIAEYTGGLFMFFKEGESFRSKFKYLAPAFRGLLVSGEIKL